MERKPFKLTVMRYGVRHQQLFRTLLEAVRFALDGAEENTHSPDRISEDGVVIWNRDGASLDSLRMLCEAEVLANPVLLQLEQEAAWIAQRVRDWVAVKCRSGGNPAANLRAAEMEFAQYLQHDDGHRQRETSKDKTAMGEQPSGGSK